MKKILLLLGLSTLISLTSLGQSPYVMPLRYTATGLTVFNIDPGCYGGSGIKLYVNDAVIPASQAFCTSGICIFSFPFGTFGVGDKFYVKDGCGNTSNTNYVQDDYVYIETPENGISPAAEHELYYTLSNPVSAGKCLPVDINSHALHSFELLVGTNNDLLNTYQTGVIKVNGIAITAGEVSLDKLGNPAHDLSVSAGAVEYKGGGFVTVNQRFSGRTPVSIEYIHNGILPFDVQEFRFGPMAMRMWDNNSITVKEYRYDSSVIDLNLNGNYSNSSFKFTFDLGFFKLYVDGIEVKSIARSVIYSASDGTLSNGGLLSYASGITWTPSSSGTQWVGAIIDGVRYTRQKFDVAEDMVINQSVSDVACNGGVSGRISVTATGGKSPLQYSKDGVSYQGSSVFSGLSSGNYTVYVRDASGCIASKNVYVGENPALTLSAGTVTNAVCNGDNNGAVQLNAAGGSGNFQYGINNGAYQPSNVISGLQAGIYNFWVKDGSGCTTGISQTIGQNSTLLVAIASQNDVSCFSGKDGSVTLNTSGSLPAGTLQYSKDGITYQASPLFNGLAAGTYDFTVKDNICQVTVNVVINQPAQLTAGGNVSQNVSCFAGNNGQIEVMAGGGTPDYEYAQDGVSFVTGSVFGGLMAGNYKFWIRDAKGCVAQTGIYTITQPSVLQVLVTSKSEVKCFGGSYGSVTVSASGGSPDYNYSLDGINFQTENTFTGLNAGSKTIIVRDNNGCIKTVTTDILQPSAPLSMINVQQDNLVCNSDNSGKVILDATEGTAPYQYSLNGIDFQTGSTFSGLSAGVYTFSVKDVNSCLYHLNLEISQPSPVSITHTRKLDVDCEYYQKGELSFMASGSNGGFNYYLNGTDLLHNNINAIQNADGVFKDLPVGNYTLTAIDSKGCRKDYAAAVVPKNSSIRFEISKQLPDNCTTANGKITVINTSGGRPQPDYHYRISSQAGFTTANNFENLINGNYIITVADELCSYNQEVDLRLPQSLTAGYKISPVDCQTPKANVLIDPVSGGNGNYQLALNGGFSPGRNFNDLNPGTYGVQIKDDPFSCQTMLSFEIKEQNRADLKTDFVQQISCFGGSDGIIRVKGDNNVGPFTYSFQNQDNFSVNNQFGSLPVGTYKVYAQNAIGCRDTIRVTLSQPTKIEWNVLTRNNDCFGDKTGEITVSGSGGTPPYQYAIDHTFTDSGDFRSLTAGFYNTRIKDSKGCEFSKNTELIQPSEVKLRSVYQDTIRCFGENNGAVFITAEGGTPGYVYAINESNQYVNNPLFKNLTAGHYKFYVKDSKQCLKQTELTVTEPEKLKISLLSQENPLCYGEKNGKISIDAKGGNEGYSYILDNVKTQKNGYFDGLTQGTYTFKVSDRKQCEDTISKVSLVWPKSLAAAMNITPPVCFGDKNGKVNIEINGGLSPYSYIFSPAGNNPYEGFAHPQTSTIDLDSLSSGRGYLSLHDKNGCQLGLTVNIPAPDKLNEIVFDNLPEEVCKGQEVWLLTNNSGKNTRWYFNEAEISQTSSTGASELKVVEPGKYKVVVSNATGCTVSNTYELKNNNQAMIADFLMTIQAFEGDTVYALDISKPAPDEIIWKLPQDANILHQDVEGMTFQMVLEGVYTIEMIAKKGECENRKIREIEIFRKEDIDKTSGDLFYGTYEIIKSMVISPNPNFGKFDIDVKLSKKEDINITITRASNGVQIYKEDFKGLQDYHIPMQLKNFIQDNYLVTVKAGSTVLMKRVLLMN